jgi:putative membrane protein
MMWYYGSGGGWNWLWMTLMMVIFWGGVIALAVWAIRSGLGSRRDRDAIDVLRHRLAAGEISQDDFEKTKRILQG